MSGAIRLVVVGGGNMGAALVGGLVDGGWDPASVCVVEIDEAKRDALASSTGVRTSVELVAADGAVVAVKPGDVAAVSARLAALGVERIVSIAAGVRLAALEAAAPEARIVRAMPNTPALVGEGITAISAGSKCTEVDMAWAESVLSAVGLVVRIPESQMDAVTAVAGSGPGYLFLFAEALSAAAIEEGLPADVADALVRQLFKGAGALLAGSTESPAVLRERVTSPNGTTAAGLARFEAAGLRDTVRDAVRAAAARSLEMGKE